MSAVDEFMFFQALGCSEKSKHWFLTGFQRKGVVVLAIDHHARLGRSCCKIHCVNVGFFREAGESAGKVDRALKSGLQRTDNRSKPSAVAVSHERKSGLFEFVAALKEIDGSSDVFDLLDNGMGSGPRFGFCDKT
jgi:hypothetical protein